MSAPSVRRPWPTLAAALLYPLVLGFGVTVFGIGWAGGRWTAQPSGSLFGPQDAELRLCLPSDAASEQSPSVESQNARQALEECEVARYYAGRGYVVVLSRYSPQTRWQVRSVRPLTEAETLAATK